MRWRKLMIGVVAVVVCAAPVVGAGRAETVPEPTGYKSDDYRSPTPDTLQGARVATPDAAFATWKAGRTLFIDAMPRPPKPEELPEGTIWQDKPRPSIPGAVWLVNVGYGRLNGERDSYFRRSLEVLTGGDKAKPLLFFCQANCWMSWNAAKRAREEYGYTDVTWFPLGTDGWQVDAAPLVEAQPYQLGER